MKLVDVMNMFVAARHFAEAAEAGVKAKTNLASACEALQPFADMDLMDFANLIRQAEEYRRTGVLPVVATKSARKPSTSRKPALSPDEKASQVELLVRQLQDLYGVVHEETVGFGAIDEMCETVAKLNLPEVKKVAEGFGLKLPTKASKTAALAEIKRKLTEKKGSAQQTAPIGAS